VSVPVTEFEDLVAFVALHRRGAMDQIPGHERGKHNPDTLGFIDDPPARDHAGHQGRDGYRSVGEPLHGQTRPRGARPVLAQQRLAAGAGSCVGRARRGSRHRAQRKRRRTDYE
jgi:hypothetical protein